IWDRQGCRYVVFDVDATRQAARQRALSCDPTLPSPRRRLDEVCAPGYTGRKRGEIVRTRTVALQMHTRQWVGTYAGRGVHRIEHGLTELNREEGWRRDWHALPPLRAI